MAGLLKQLTDAFNNIDVDEPSTIQANMNPASDLFDIESMPIDPKLITKIERNARLVEKSLDELLTNLNEQMTEISKTSTEYTELYHLSMENLGDVIKKSTEQSVNLISKCDEVCQDIELLFPFAQQIKEIKASLDILEKLI